MRRMLITALLIGTGVAGSPLYPDASKLVEQRLDKAVTVIRDGLGARAEHK